MEIRKFSKLIFITLTVLTSFYVSSQDLCTIPTFEQQIQAFVSETYKESYSTLLSESEIKQLAWLKGNLYQTNEKNVVYLELMQKEPPQDRALQEVKRAISRIYNLELLKQGGPEAYKAFIFAQQAAKLPDILSPASFESLSKNIQQLDKDAYQALRVATLLSSVTLSIPAKEQAAPRLQAKGMPMPVDSVEFMATTIDHCPDIYPLVKTLSEQGFSYLKMAFPYRTHFRHMMYTEGGLGMFEALKNKIQAKQLDQAALGFWYAYWMINITGFRGHLNPQGSVYLSENTFRAMTTLKTFLDEYIQNPSSNILRKYLEARSEWVGLGAVKNKDKQLVLAHMAAMLRLYTHESGLALLQGFDAIPESIQNKILIQYTSSLSLTQAQEPTPTYAPALFANALDALKGDIVQTVKIFLPIYASTLENYRNLRKENKIAPNIPLNFNSLAAAPIVKMIINDASMDKRGVLPIEIDPKTGEAKLVERDLVPKVP